MEASNESEHESQRKLAESWDKEAVYKAEIAPLLKQLQDLCVKNGLPCLIAVHYKNPKEDGNEVSIMGYAVKECYQMKMASVALQMGIKRFVP